MEPLKRTSSSISIPNLTHVFPTSITSNRNDSVLPITVDHDSPDTVRQSAPVPEPEQRRGTRQPTTSGGETWNDFLTSTAALTGDGEDASGSKAAGPGIQPYESAGRKRQPTISDETGNKRVNTEQDLSFTTSTSRTGSASNPIDLTSPERPSRTSSMLPVIRRASIDSIVLPTWQADSEVNSCPVCGTLFSFWYRKHHCRKCGRVVCANCSPHRITMPRQFIVQPPATLSPFLSFTGGVLEITDYNRAPGEPQAANNFTRRPSASLSGGETVRVCNPCVPDPNLSPPPQRPFLPNLGSTSSAITAVPQLPRPAGPPSSFSNPNIRPSAASNISTSQAIGPHANTSRPPVETGRRATIAPITGALPQLPSLQRMVPPFAQSLGQATLGLAARSYNPRFAERAARASSSAPRHPQLFPSRRVPARRIREEDECPVCGHELPPKGPEGEEDARIAHVDACIQRYSAPSAGASSNTAVPLTAPTTDTTSSGVMVHAPANEPPAQVEEAASTAPPRPRGVGGNRMLVYRASEKDYIGDDGEPQECVICFEEFEPGDELGRLECLCKFHRVGQYFSIFRGDELIRELIGLHTAMVGNKRCWKLSYSSAT